MSSDRKPRNYYIDYSKRRQGNNRRGPSNNESNNARFKQTPEFDAGGNRGFIITAVDEVKSYLEMRQVMEQYFHEIYDSHETKSGAKKEMSTEDELESELKHLRFTRPFKQVKTHCRNAIFLNIVNDFSYVDPITLVDRFFDDMDEKQTSRTSNTCRVLPVLDTFRNNVASAKESITKLLADKYPDEESKRYFIEFQSRGNYKLETEDKQRMIEGVAEAVHAAKPSWEVGRENADYIIALTALRNICCLSILKNYFKRNKYNVIEFCKRFLPDEANLDGKQQGAEQVAGDNGNNLTEEEGGGGGDNKQEE